MDVHSLFTPPVIWFLIGLGLLLLELILPGLIVIFFGLGAWITALGLWIFNYGINMQLLVFAVSSVAMLLLLRKSLKQRFFSTSEESDALEDEFIGKVATALTTLPANVPGKVEFKGTQWSAVSDSEIPQGGAAKIIGKDSLTLKVTAIN